MLLQSSYKVFGWSEISSQKVIKTHTHTHNSEQPIRPESNKKEF